MKNQPMYVKDVQPVKVVKESKEELTETVEEKNKRFRRRDPKNEKNHFKLQRKDSVILLSLFSFIRIFYYENMGNKDINLKSFT